MANLGEGLDSPAIEQNPDIARLQSAALGAQLAASIISLPATGFVSSLNGQEGSIVVQAGTSTTGVTVNITNGAGTVSIGVSIPVIAQLGPLATIKCNFTAVVAPTANDDSGDGYDVGSQWIDVLLDDAYICVDDTLTAAVWKKITP